MLFELLLCTVEEEERKPLSLSFMHTHLRFYTQNYEIYPTTLDWLSQFNVTTITYNQLHYLGGPQLPNSWYK